MQPLGKFKTCIVHRVVENIAHVAPINLYCKSVQLTKAAIQLKE